MDSDVRKIDKKTWIIIGGLLTMLIGILIVGVLRNIGVFGGSSQRYLQEESVFL